MEIFLAYLTTRMDHIHTLCTSLIWWFPTFCAFMFAVVLWFIVVNIDESWVSTTVERNVKNTHKVFKYITIVMVVVGFMGAALVPTSTDLTFVEQRIETLGQDEFISPDGDVLILNEE